MSADPWVALDRDVGVSVFFSVDADGRVVTPAPRVAASRERSATDRDDLGRAQRIAALITAHLGLSAVARPSGGNVEVDLSSDGWLGRCGAETGIIAGAAADVRRARPPLRSFGQSLTWDAVAQDVGLDALVWASLLSASKTPPLTLGQRLDDLSSRRDANPLARARRAQAAAMLRLEAATGLLDSGALDADTFDVEPLAYGDGADTPARDDLAVGGSAALFRSPDGGDHVTPAPLRVAVLLTSRAFHDAARTGRTRPALLAIDDLAVAMLRHVEAAPVTRTDVPALSAARSIVRETLDAACVAAPVPY